MADPNASAPPRAGIRLCRATRLGVSETPPRGACPLGRSRALLFALRRTHMNEKDTRRLSGGIRRLGVLTGNTLMRTAIYLIVLLLAAASGLVVDWVATWSNDDFMLATMTWVGNALMLVDGVLLLWTAVVSAYRAFKA